MTIELWLSENIKKLKQAEIESARLDCLLILGDVLRKNREWLLAHDDTEISSSHLLMLNTKVAQRLTHKPLAYIRNTQEFYGRNFYLDENVLIPRPESESIINLLLSAKYELTTTVIDIGTGSGCLAVTTKLELPDTKVVACDISDNALKIAKRNAKNLHANIDFVKSDLLTSIPDLQSSIFLANLPYVPTNLITSPEITHEPTQALFSGTDGLDMYREFWQQVAKLPSKPHAIITESLETQHRAMQEYARQSGYILASTEVLAQEFILDQPNQQ